MYRLTRVVICVFAILFAATGVLKVTAADAESARVAHGAFRIVFGSVVCVGALRALVRGRPVDPVPAGSDPSGPSDALGPGRG